MNQPRYGHKSLCLACSSSLPPSKSQFSCFTTNCCQRPICPSCITSNPRLARYDPCLACLARVNLLASTSTSALGTTQSTSLVNISGEVRDQDVFVLGDDDEELEGTRVEIPISTTTVDDTQVDLPSPQEAPAKYYLNRSDTLQGLSLRFGIDVRPNASTFHLLIQSLRCTRYASSTTYHQASSATPISYTHEPF